MRVSQRAWGRLVFALLTLASATLFASALTASPAEARLLAEDCEGATAVCTEAKRHRDDVTLAISGASVSGKYGLCVRPPRGSPWCREFRLGRRGADAIVWDREFPDGGPGRYRAVWSKGGERLAPALRFRLPRGLRPEFGQD